MAQSGGSSFLEQSARRKSSLAKVRQTLLDRPGIARQGGPPPPTAPAQNRTSPQERSVQQTRRPSQQAPQPQQAAPAAAQGERPVSTLNLDPPTRQAMLEQITPFVDQMRKERRARLHPTLGRTRTFFGSGI